MIRHLRMSKPPMYALNRQPYIVAKTRSHCPTNWIFFCNCFIGIPDNPLSSG